MQEKFDTPSEADVDGCTENIDLRDRSKRVQDPRPLVSFLYELMRDHVPPGIVERVVRNSATSVEDPTIYTNGFLAMYAQDLANRLDAKS